MINICLLFITIKTARSSNITEDINFVRPLGVCGVWSFRWSLLLKSYRSATAIIPKYKLQTYSNSKIATRLCPPRWYR